MAEGTTKYKIVAMTMSLVPAYFSFEGCFKNSTRFFTEQFEFSRPSSGSWNQEHSRIQTTRREEW